MTSSPGGPGGVCMGRNALSCTYFYTRDEIPPPPVYVHTTRKGHELPLMQASAWSLLHQTLVLLSVGTRNQENFRGPGCVWGHGKHISLL